MEKGLENGLKKGIDKGIKEDSKDNSIKITKKLLLNGMDRKDVGEITGILINEIGNL